MHLKRLSEVLKSSFNLLRVIQIKRIAGLSKLLGAGMKLKYFKLKEAFNEARESFSYGTGTEKLSSTAKFLGKSVANVGMLAVEIGVDVVKNLPEANGRVAKRVLDENSDSMSEQQKEKALLIVENGKEHERKRKEKERSEREKELRNNGSD